MLRLYIDEDATSRALLAALRATGIDVTSVADERRRERTDEEQLTFAAATGRTIFSYNVADFMRLHSRYMLEQRTHAGITLVRQGRYGVGELCRRLGRLARELEPNAMVNRIEFLNDWG